MRKNRIIILGIGIMTIIIFLFLVMWSIKDLSDKNQELHEENEMLREKLVEVNSQLDYVKKSIDSNKLSNNTGDPKEISMIQGQLKIVDDNIKEVRDRIDNSEKIDPTDQAMLSRLEEEKEYLEYELNK